MSTPDALFDVTEEEFVKPTHGLSLNILVRGSTEWEEIHDRFVRDMKELGLRFASVSMYSSMLDEDDGVEERGEYFDENTMFKVRSGIESGLSPLYSAEKESELQQMITDIISGMQNEGILFRERS